MVFNSEQVNAHLLALNQLVADQARQEADRLAAKALSRLAKKLGAEQEKLKKYEDQGGCSGRAQLLLPDGRGRHDAAAAAARLQRAAPPKSWCFGGIWATKAGLLRSPQLSGKAGLELREG